jgi:hypothetical protein
VRSIFKYVLIILATVLCIASSATGDDLSYPENFPRREIFLSTNDGTSLSLPDSFLIRGSETISTLDTLLTRNVHYRIDYTTGSVTLLLPYPKERLFTVVYRYLPLNLKRSWYRRQMVYEKDTIAAPVRKKEQEPPAVRERSDLRKNGSIVRGISLGSNQGLKVESGLRMNISGKIADRVEVLAALTDQNTPIQPEGNTQTLNEIDKVFVQIKSDRFNATLGDYYLSFKGSEFGHYERKLQGAMGIAEFDNYKVTLSGAVSKGKYTTNQFQGQEGNQGPYQLTGENGEIDIIVLAGTEKVWIDGELMTRGETNDYVIEYSNGELTFTRQRLITADSRITVDFQYSDLQFQRSLYSARTQADLWDGRIQVDMRYLRESDNEDNPLDFVLTDEHRAQLERAGDNLDSAYVSGVRFSGDGKGYYVQVDSADVRFYRYAGADSGDYNVSFSYVGPNKGDYRSVGFGNYKYIGPNKGSYAPVIFLKPAQQHDVGDFGVTLNLGKAIRLSTEIAASRLDRNAYSSRDDGDNAGMAYTSQITLAPEKMMLGGINFGKMSLKGKYRNVNSRFQYIDRTDEVEKSRKWDSAEAATQAEEIREMSAEYQPVKDIVLGLGYGDIDKGSGFSSRRWDATAGFGLQRWPQVQYRIESIESDNVSSRRQGDWIRQAGNASYTLWKLRPFVSYLGENKKEVFQDTLKTGFQYDEYASGLELKKLKNLDASASFTVRQDDQYGQGGFSPTSESMTQKYELGYKKGRNFSASAQYIHRDRTYTDSSTSDKKTDLGDLKVNYSAYKEAVKTNWHYQISNTQVAKKERVYFKVSEGEGNYRFNEETGEYEPDDYGDYVLRIRQTDDFIPVVELRASSRIRFSPEKFFAKKRARTGWEKWLSAVSTETYIRLEEKTQEKDVWSIYRLDLGQFQQPGVTIFGNNSLRQDLYVFRNRRDMSLRLRYDRRKEVNFQYLEGGNRNSFTEWSFRLTRQFGERLGVQLEGTQFDKSYLYTARSDKIIDAREMSLDISYRPKQIIEVALKSQIALKRDGAPDPATEANELTVSPRAGYSFRGKGKLRLEFEWERMDVAPANRIVPYELVGINRPGTTMRWLLGFNYNISKYVRATVSYNGRIEPDRPDTVHIGRAEMRAYF